MSSVISTPDIPISARSTPSITARECEAGRSGSMALSVTWPTIIMAPEFDSTRLNGAQSDASSSSTDASMLVRK